MKQLLLLPGQAPDESASVGERQRHEAATPTTKLPREDTRSKLAESKTYHYQIAGFVLLGQLTEHLPDSVCY